MSSITDNILKNREKKGGSYSKWKNPPESLEATEATEERVDPPENEKSSPAEKGDKKIKPNTTDKSNKSNKSSNLKADPIPDEKKEAAIPSDEEVGEMQKTSEPEKPNFHKPKMTETHVQKSYYIHRELAEAIDEILGPDSRSKYKFVNEALKLFIQTFYPKVYAKIKNKLD